MVEFSFGVKVWWAVMSVVAAFNIALWCAVYKRLNGRRTLLNSDLFRYRQWQCWMAGIYVLGCASRSVVLRGDVQRHSMIDSWFASVMVGRTIATIAEICFVVQWALLLHWMARSHQVKMGERIAWVLVPLIVFAETASWYGVLTTNYLGNAIEESTWTFTAALFMVGLMLCYRKAAPQLRKWIGFALACGVAYLAFMVSVDVPTYISRWQSDLASDKVFLTLSEGLQDIQRYEVTGRWEDWKYAMVWMTPYFSLAVWLSLAMVLWPRFKGDGAPSNG